MKNLIRLILLAALVALGVWLWTVFFPSPEKIIRKQLAEVARSASFVSNEGPLARVANATKLAGYFSEDVQMNFEVPSHGRQEIRSRDDVVRGAVGARSMFSALKVEFPDVVVKLASDKQSADVEITVKARVPGEQDFFVQEMKFVMKKIKGDWLIVRVETVKTLLRGEEQGRGA